MPALNIVTAVVVRWKAFVIGEFERSLQQSMKYTCTCTECIAKSFIYVSYILTVQYEHIERH